MAVSELPHGVAFWLHLGLCSNAVLFEKTFLKQHPCTMCLLPHFPFLQTTNLYH